MLASATASDLRFRRLFIWRSRLVAVPSPTRSINRVPPCHDEAVTSPGTATGLDHVGRFARAAERFADLVAAVDLGAPVLHCPGWTAYDVVTHLGNVHA